MAHLSDWKKTGMFVPYYGKAWDPGSDQDAYTEVMGWALNLQENLERGFGLLISGSPGRGKTLLAHLAGNAVLDSRDEFPGVTLRNMLYATTVQGYLDLFRRQMDCMDILRKTGDSEVAASWSEAERTITAIKTKIKVLLLDDIGKEHTTATGFAQNQIERLIRARGNRGLANIITTNMDMLTLGDLYGESFSSYLFQVCHPVFVYGGDHRLRSIRGSKG